MYYLDVVPQHDSIITHEHDLNPSTCRPYPHGISAFCVL